MAIKRIKENYPGIKEMYEKGCPIEEIAKAFSISKYSIYNAVSAMGISKRLIQKIKKKKYLYMPIIDHLCLKGLL